MSFYDEILRCERARLELDEEEVPADACEICGSKNYDYILKDKDGYIVGCDDCVTKVYL